MAVVNLNRDDKDLDFLIKRESDGEGPAVGQSMDSHMWSGCRANFGVATGKVAFAVHIKSGTLCRIGWGTGSASLNLGQSDQSFGFGGTGKKSTNNSFTNYGQPFGNNDVVTALVDQDAHTISFMKNEGMLGEAFNIPKKLWGVPLFPHVLTKNATMDCYFDDVHQQLYPLPPGYKWIQQAHNQKATVPSEWGENRDQALQHMGGAVDEDSEFVNYSAGPDLTGAGPNQRRLIMLVGMPGTGKTFWAKDYVKNHPEMKFQLLSTNLIMERLMPNTKHTYRDRFEKLIKEASGILEEQLKVASRENGNIIWDQTNVFPSARQRKLRQFQQFRKTAVVFLPDQETHEQWVQNQFEENGQSVPDKVIKNFQSNFVLPEVGDEAGFDEVIYAFGNSPADRRAIMQRYKEEAAGRAPKRQREFDTEERPAKRDFAKAYEERQFQATGARRAGDQRGYQQQQYQQQEQYDQQGHRGGQQYQGGGGGGRQYQQQGGYNGGGGWQQGGQRQQVDYNQRHDRDRYQHERYQYQYQHTR